METLKMKFKLHALEFEIEGSEEVVTTEFKSFHDNILNPLLTKVNIMPPAQPANGVTTWSLPEGNTFSNGKDTPQATTDAEIPHITDIENTLECSEQHWILIYAFYLSEHGTTTFGKDNLLKAYKEKRETPSRIANFSNKWKSLFKGLVKTIKTDEFKLTDKGIETAVGLIQGKIKSEASRTLPNKKSSDKKSDKEPITNKKSGKTPAKSIQIEEFDLYKGTKKPALSDFLKEGKSGENTNHRILAIAYYIIQYCKAESFSEGNIEYAYKVLGLNKRPVHLYQIIVNAKNKNLWFDKHQPSGKWKLTRAGEVFFEENLSKK